MVFTGFLPLIDKLLKYIHHCPPILSNLPHGLRENPRELGPQSASALKLDKLVVLVYFKAIYPGVPPGIFASFPGVAHFLSFE